MTDPRPLHSSIAGDAGLSIPADVERRILQAVSSLAYGSVEIVVHDSRVVQIERREKVRVERAAEGAAPESAHLPTHKRRSGGPSAQT